MNISIEIEKTKKEYEYFRKEYETKLSVKIIFSLDYCLNSFYDFFKLNKFIVYKEQLCGEALSVDFRFNFKPKYDYLKEPRRMRIIEIQKFDIKFNKNTDFIIAILSDKPLPEPDFSRLLTNPTKGMSKKEIELLEMQKSIKYFKENTLEKENSKYWVFQASNLTDKRDLGYEKNIVNHYKKIIA